MLLYFVSIKFIPNRSDNFLLIMEKIIHFSLVNHPAIENVLLPSFTKFTNDFIQERRRGLIACRGLNSLLGSHQRWARALNLAISDWSTFILNKRGSVSKANEAFYQYSGNKKARVKRALLKVKRLTS